MSWESVEQTNAPKNKWQPLKRTAVRLGYFAPFVGAGAAAANSIYPKLGTKFEPISHSSSALVSYCIGTLAMVATTSVANHLNEKGWDKAASTLRRAGEVAAWVGSLAYQWAAESNTFALMKTGQKSDFVYGVLATFPGILFGEYFARNELVDRNPSEGVQITSAWQARLASGEA